MEKTMYWIDDSISAMKPIIEGFFPTLWNLSGDNGIRSEIIIWGNEYQEDEKKNFWSKEDENELNRKVKKFFLELCHDLDGASWDNETFCAKKELIENCARILYKKEDAEDGGKIADTMRKMEAFWHDEKKMEEWKEKAAGGTRVNEEAEELVETLCSYMQLKEKAAVAIDVRLLRHDYERVHKGYPIVSMELHHQLEVKGYSCLMYSTYNFESSYNERWKKNYKRIYGKEAPEIYSRYSLSEKGEETVKQCFRERKRTEDVSE